MSVTNSENVHAISIHVGVRIRQARLMRGMNQRELGQKISKPISFQQIQKYERGANRISVALLQEFADVMRFPITFFLPNQDIKHGCSLNREEAQLLECFHALDKNGKQALSTLLTLIRRAD